MTLTLWLHGYPWSWGWYQLSDLGACTQQSDVELEGQGERQANVVAGRTLIWKTREREGKREAS